MEKVRTLCVVCHLGEIPKGLDLDLIQCHNKRLLCTLSAGQGGGGILDPAIASTRLGKLFDMGCEDDESDRHFYVLRPLNKVPDEVATEEERIHLLATRGGRRRCRRPGTHTRS